jgi:hypothetical protein
MKTALEVAIPDHVIRDFAVSSGISTSHAEVVTRELQKFLCLCATSSQRFVPSAAVDEMWHEFILHTRDYAEFCTRNFRRFIHHVPDRDGGGKLLQPYLATIAALQSEFGSVDEQIWPHSQTYLSNVCNSCAGLCGGD